MARPDRMLIADRRTLWLVVPMAMALAPHVPHVPAWISVVAALGLAWRLTPFGRGDARRLRLPLALLALAALAGVFLEHRTLFGPQGGISLLILMAALKLVESRDRRDHTVMVLVGYFLLLAGLIHDQGLPVAAWMLLSAAILTASLGVAQASGDFAPARALRLGGTLALQALPLAVLLFLLFPRLPSPIGGLIQTRSGQTGLSDSMSPGSVSQLIRSDAVAFRAEIATPGVDGRQLYWRGPVLWDYDGRTWRRSPDRGDRVTAEALGRPMEYAVTLEPHGQQWLLVAGLAARPPLPGTGMTADMEWLSARPLRERLRYAVTAWRDYRLEAALAADRRNQALDLPAGRNPRAVALGRDWAASGLAPPARVDRALAHFRAEPFHYTLNPPLLGQEAVDEFLFDTRRGFCEHYASAFVVLMRAAGVPARVVTGYQGGELNPVGGYWIVRQRDAHAWAEVWLEGRGWTRVDPTAAVAPSRIERGLADALPPAERPALELPGQWLRPLRQGWDYVNNAWNQWVLGYDFQRQRRLLESISPRLASIRGMLWALLGGLALILAGLALWVFRKTRGRSGDRLARLYGTFCARLGRAVLPRAAAEGPADYALRAARARPELAAEIDAVSRLYVGLRYGREPPAGLAELRRRVRAFRPGRRR